MNPQGDRIEILKRRVEESRRRLEEFTRERDRASGALGEIKRRLKDEHGLNSRKEAEARITKIDSTLAELDIQLSELETRLEGVLRERSLETQG